MEVRRCLGLLLWWVFMFFGLVFVGCLGQTDASDSKVMLELRNGLKDAESKLGWKGLDPCSWVSVSCSNGRVVGIQMQNKGVEGELPSDFNKLTALSNIGFQNNLLSGALPTFKGMSALQYAFLNGNKFSFIPPDFFSGLKSLEVIALDENPLAPWLIPDNVKEAVNLANFTASYAGIVGSIPEFLGDSLANLQVLSLAFNNLTGPIPKSFSSSIIATLWLNNQVGSKLSGAIDVVAGMSSLSQLWLQSNEFTGPIPDLTKLTALQDLRLRDNQLTGVVPSTLSSLPSLGNISLINNALQGPYPFFPNTVGAVIGTATENSFCLPAPGKCDARVNILLEFANGVGYPYSFASNWKGNDPCNSWIYVRCDSAGNVIVLSMGRLGLSGIISPALAELASLKTLLLGNNNLTGEIPSELASLPSLQKLDLSNNNLTGNVPKFRDGVVVIMNGNPQLGTNSGSGGADAPSARTPSTPSGSPGASNKTSEGGGGSGGVEKRKGSSSMGTVVGSVVGGLVGLGIIVGGLGLCLHRKRKSGSGRVRSPNTRASVFSVNLQPQGSGSDPEMLKTTSLNSTMTRGGDSSSSGPSDVHMVEAGNMIISIQILRSVTNNFSEENELGRGGFGVVYKGELHDGTKIAVKRMEAGVMSNKGFNEFQAEIAVLTKVRHRHLVALLGYCIEGSERLLVYEYMPQGPLSRHLFEWEKHNLKPMPWTNRLIVALDVARGVEYLHSLAQKSFIHRDLKPSNILLGDDMRAKVSDFGLVRLAPEGKYSIETRLAGTFGYLAPEYAVTGRVTTKADVFSFGVILMELITGRRALDESQPEESMHLVTWFRRMHINKETFRSAIDSALEVSEETLKGIFTIAELAGHCTAREPYQRPDMGHAVNVLSPLVEQWKPTDAENEDYYGIDLDMTLPQALKKWQAFENSNMDDSVTSMDNTQSSIPTRPAGFADSFTSTDGR
ncbi:hypothetical protein SUGI_0180800 [Cryptomeria japonica]|nr:hypothetical protein SUGI_0180800 [Cryptomeria japonica]